jgi:phosphoribosylanthranilate isomerase
MGHTALRVKICGITQPSQGRAIAELGAAMLGFICAPVSPRFVTPVQIAEVVSALPLDSQTGALVCDRVGVFVNASLEIICETVAIGRLTGVQLHGDEPPAFCQQVKHVLPEVELIKALRIASWEALEQARLYDSVVDTLLLDAYHPTLLGGTGHTLDWSSLQAFAPQTPWLLAGGLTPDNICAALTLIHPDGVDLSSGVELSPGNKDLQKVAQLFHNLASLDGIQMSSVNV